MYLGIDLGTSGVKVILLDQQHKIVASHSESLTVSRPHSLWSEQDPADWWAATNKAVLMLKSQLDLMAVKAIGLSGQMHGATILDKNDQVLRPAILWNDGRSAKQCQTLEAEVPDSRIITGNLMMPGFTAPKLKWLAEHEPNTFKKISKVLLPKDYLRLLMTGDYATDMSDAAGTLWLDVAKRDWSDTLLAACQLTREQMPQLFEGNQITGTLLPHIAKEWGMQNVPVVAGGGDNAAGAVGMGIIKHGQGMLSLGTSGVYFCVSDGFFSNPQQAVHSFCHALPNTWHLMSVILSAASCLDWSARLTGHKNVETLLNEVENCSETAPPLWFLPYLSGERTPHNNPAAKGSFWGLTHQHQRANLNLAVLEGVSFALADGMDVLHATSVKPTEITLIGGGARSAYWRQLLADISGQHLIYRVGGEVGPALGAAKLAMAALNPHSSLAELCPPLPIAQVHIPEPVKYQQYQEKREIFRQIYQQLLPLCM